MVIQPFLEIGFRRRIVVLDVVIKALEAILGFQVEQAVFERIFYVSASIENFVVAARAVDVIAEERNHVVHHLLIARKDDVWTTGVVGEAILLDGLAMASAAGFLFQDLALFFEVRGDGNAR